MSPQISPVWKWPPHAPRGRIPRSENARVVDRIAVTVDQAGQVGGVIVPAGATLVGWIRSIEKPADGNFTLAMEFAKLQNGDRKARFFARLTEVTRCAQDEGRGPAWRGNAGNSREISDEYLRFRSVPAPPHRIDERLNRCGQTVQIFVRLLLGFGELL